ncbi:helix-turn-helix transcriptional regulator [Nocardiopsis eucommiae]|uniref:Helix-turn-helix transcriptional regulator n=1 Tax=Nocardiopsis eucommiae TaxID=2831970 RepID=A0A975L871_9ACTN|nr:helix-turn-helix transcriptional regulator [Nocardiopsis eucommiae]
MESEQVRGSVDQGDVTRANSLARSVFSDIADKWSLLVVNVLGDRTLRFTELHRSIEGVSHKMLTQTLRRLERNGLVERTVHPVVPPQVDYRLTEAGRDLRDTVNGLCGWARRHLDVIEEARRLHG